MGCGGVERWDDLEGRIRSLEAAVMHMAGRVGSPAVPSGDSPPLAHDLGSGTRSSNAILADWATALAAEQAVSAGLRENLAAVNLARVNLADDLNEVLEEVDRLKEEKDELAARLERAERDIEGEEHKRLRYGEVVRREWANLLGEERATSGSLRRELAETLATLDRVRSELQLAHNENETLAERLERAERHARVYHWSASGDASVLKSGDMDGEPNL